MATKASVPSPPTGLCERAAATTSSTAELEWQAAEAHGAPVSAYQVFQTETGGSAAAGELVYSGPERHCRVTGLKPARMYVFTAQATNAMGPSEHSSPLVVTTKPSTPGAPKRPKLVFATADSATFAWCVPTDSGSPITHFRLQLNEQGSYSKPLVGDPGELQRYTFAGLQPSTRYSVREGRRKRG